MKKIMIALNNKKIYKKLKKIKNWEIIFEDIQYKEAVIELLEKNNSIDFIIINEKIPGQINLLNLINKINKINNKIKVIIINKKNNKMEENLKKINNIFFLNSIKIKKIIEIINSEQKNNKKINKYNFKVIVKKIEIIKTIIIINIKNIINLILKKEYFFKLKEKNNKNTKKENKKILTISGNRGVGKSVVTLILSKVLQEKGKKIAILDMDFDNENIHTLLGIKQNKKEIEKIFLNKNTQKNIINYIKIKSKIKNKKNRRNKK